MITSIHRQQSPEKLAKIPIIDTHLNNRLSNNNDNNNLNTHQTTLNILTPQRQYIRQTSNTDSVQSGINDLTSRPSSISPIKTTNQEKLNFISTYQPQQLEEKISHRTSSITSSSRRSSDRFPPPPQNIEIFDSTINNSIQQQRSTSSMSYRSSINDDIHTPDVSLFFFHPQKNFVKFSRLN